MSKKNRPTINIPGLDELEEERGRLPGSSIDTHYLRQMSKGHEEEGGFVASEYPLALIEPDFYQGRGGQLRTKPRRIRISRKGSWPCAWRDPRKT